jgi:hypothetical protein
MAIIFSTNQSIDFFLGDTSTLTNQTDQPTVFRDRRINRTEQTERVIRPNLSNTLVENKQGKKKTKHSFTKKTQFQTEQSICGKQIDLFVCFRIFFFFFFFSYDEIMTTLERASLQYWVNNTVGTWCVPETNASRGPAARHCLSQVAASFIGAEAKTSIVQGFEHLKQVAHYCLDGGYYFRFLDNRQQWPSVVSFTQQELLSIVHLFKKDCWLAWLAGWQPTNQPTNQPIRLNKKKKYNPGYPECVCVRVKKKWTAISPRNRNLGCNSWLRNRVGESRRRSADQFTQLINWIRPSARWGKILKFLY